MKELFQSGRKHILVSLKGVTYIDSSCLGRLAGCYVTASRSF